MTPSRWHPGRLVLLWLILLSAATWIVARLRNPFVVVGDDERLVIYLLALAALALLVVTWRWFGARQARRDLIEQAMLERIRRG